MTVSRNEGLRVGLVGAGLQGRRRAPILRQFPGTRLVVIAAAQEEHARPLADSMGCQAIGGWQGVVARDDLDAVVVCTPTNLHAQISVAAMEKGMHVLCEKPIARTLDEAREMIRVSHKAGVKLKCGFNHRYHPGIQKARQWFDEGAIGEIDFMRCRYGICGRPGYDKEWRAKQEIAGGGHLMEQGIHGLDLFHWFLGEFTDVTGFTATRFWDMAPLEDNAFALLRTSHGQVASLHSSLTQWKNLFSLEIFGRDGYILVEGLGGSYGNERAILGKRAFLEPFREEVIEYRGDDRSWYEEWKEFVASLREDREPLGNAFDGLEALKLVYAIYDSAASGRVVKVNGPLLGDVS